MREALDYGLYYRQWHDESLAHRELQAAILLALLTPYLPARRDVEALDIGCGMGFAMSALAECGFKRIRGVDIDKSQVEACLRQGLEVQQISDLESYLSEHSGQFGLVVMLDVLEHIPVASQIDVLRAVNRSLAPDGRLILQVPNASSMVATRWLYQDFTHTSSFTEQSLAFALRNASFATIDIPPLDNQAARPSLRPAMWKKRETRWMFKRWIVRWFWRTVLEVEFPGLDISRIPLSLNLIAVADK